MKPSRLLAILSLCITIPGAWSATLNVNNVSLPASCPEIAPWHPKPQTCTNKVAKDPSPWCAGSYTDGGCCRYNKIKWYCATDGSLTDIAYSYVGYAPNTECHTALDGTGDCVIPTSIAP